eukprot:maker-scaffold_7-snap-gene-10.20-mRNA-1 protein AED:0.21 eAED:0.21 QI:114/1/1/1/0.5/0.33/3/680/359
MNLVRKMAQNMQQKRIFRFGLISDIQTADIDDAPNFVGTEIRHYRGALEAAKLAVQDFNLEEVDFVLQVGDIIDGQNAGNYGQLKGKEPQSHQAFQRIFSVLDKVHPKAMTYHSVGNHELYNFSFTELKSLLNRPNRHKISEGDRFYFSFSPSPGWRIIQLNAYEVSILNQENKINFEEAKRVIKENNPNWKVLFAAELEGKDQGTVNYAEGLSGGQLRFVPYNGGLGEKQLNWCKTELEAASKNKENVIVLSHIPVHPNSSIATYRTLIFDYDKLLHLFHTVGKKIEDSKQSCVKIVFCGHAHKGGFYEDKEKGINYITVQSPLAKGLSHGVVDVFDEKVLIRGVGSLPSREISLTKR